MRKHEIGESIEPAFIFDVFSYSNKGDRDGNEDAVAWIENRGRLFCTLADGLGGHGYGEVASRIVVQTAMELYDTKSSSCAQMGELFQVAQDRVITKQEEEGDNSIMKTTLCVLSIQDNQALIGHIGDSRVYHFSRKRSYFRTKDHSVPQALVNSGKLPEKKIRFHEDRNRLLRAIGIEWNEPKYEIEEPREIKNGDAFLLCSDGFWELIDERKMMKLLKKTSSAEEWILSMEQIIRQSESQNKDNYSAIAVWVK